MNRISSRRLGAALSAAALAFGILATAPAVATAKVPTDTSSAARAGGWLMKNLQDGLIPSSYGGYNYGASADAVVSLSAVGRTKQAQSIADALETNIDHYISGYDPSSPYSDSQDSIYAGSTAKAVVALQAVGADPTNVNGENLVSKLEGTVLSSGRISDTSNYGDYGNVLGQSFAVRALVKAKSPKAAAVTTFLISQQCKGGWFREYFSNTVDANYVETNYDTACDKDKTAKPYTDATAYAVLALAGQKSKAAKASLTKAVAWLLKSQAKNGGFGSTESGGSPNANSTGLAAQALHAVSKATVATRAAKWLATRQVPKCTSGPLANASGAIGYNDAAIAAARKKGWSAASDQWLVANAQALPALAYAKGTKTKVTCR